MIAKNGTGSGAPAKAPEPARGESAGAGEEKEMIEKLFDAFANELGEFLWYASIKVMRVEREIVWFRVQWEDHYSFQEFLNWYMLYLREYGGYRDVKVHIESVTSPYLVHLAVPRRRLI